MQHKTTTGKIVVFYLKIHFGNFMIRKILWSKILFKQHIRALPLSFNHYKIMSKKNKMIIAYLFVYVSVYNPPTIFNITEAQI